MPNIEELKKICQDRSDKHDFYMWGVIRKISIYLTWLFVRTPITPNQLTVFSIGFGLIGALFFLSPNPWHWIAGWFVINLHLILDQCDGEVAYYKKKVTRFGYFFDEISHPIVNTFFFVMLMVGAYNITNDFSYIFLGGVLVFSVSIYRMVGLYEAYINKEMFKIKTHKISMPENWIRRIGGIPWGLGGYFHIFLVAAILDIINGSSALTIPFSFREVFLVVMAIGFPVMLIRRIYMFKSHLKSDKI